MRVWKVFNGVLKRPRNDPERLPVVVGGFVARCSSLVAPGAADRAVDDSAWRRAPAYRFPPMREMAEVS